MTDATTFLPTTPLDDQSVGKLRALSERRGLRKVTILSWRDAADPDAGGSEVHAAHVARIWAAAGLDVTLRASATRGLPEREVRDGYSVIRRSGRQSVFPATIAEELRSGRNRSDGVLELWNGVPYLTPLWCRRPKVTFIHHVHHDMWGLTLAGRRADFGRLLETRLAPPIYRWSRILTPSQASKDEIVEILGLPPEHIRVVEPGVDPQFTPGGGRSPSPTIVAVGRLVPYKKFETLISIMPEIARRVPGARLLIVGDGYHRAPIEAAIESHGAGSLIEMRGRVSNEELIRAYREAWVLASASVAEGWGMTITEAAACGTPAVVYRVGGHVDAVSHGVTGLLAGSTEELTDSVVRVLCDGDLRDRLTENAVAAAADHSWESTATAIVEELTRI